MLCTPAGIHVTVRSARRPGIALSMHLPSHHRAPSRIRFVASVSGKSSGKERVVILGSGWAGYTIAQRLDPTRFEPVVVSPRSYFVFTPLLASTAVGTLEFRTALEPVRSKRSKVTFFQGWADRIDFKNKIISVEEAVGDPLQGRARATPRASKQGEARDQEKKVENEKGKLFDVHYDKLVISVGCYAQTFNIKGVREHAYFLKDAGDARRIRNRLLSCFEGAALPTTSVEMKRHLLNFVIVGGGPTGIEFAAEMHDLIVQDMVKLYPELADKFKITLYDVAPKVLSMFDEKLSQYAVTLFRREGIQVKTSRYVEELRTGLPKSEQGKSGTRNDLSCLTLKVREEGEIGVGMVVWSTGLMMNPLVSQDLSASTTMSASGVQYDGPSPESSQQWLLRKHPKTGALITDDRLRIIADADDRKAVMSDVFAIGDCAAVDGEAYPATAQVASQQAYWLAQRLNKGDIEQKKFAWRNMGVLAYLGSSNAIMQNGRANISGRLAWLVWRGAYLTKSVSWRNKALIPIYWFLNWLFGRDISRF